MDLSCLMRGFSLYLGLGSDIGLGFTRDRFWQSTVHFAQRRFSRITVCHSITNPNPILRPLVPDTQFPEPNPQQKGSSLNISWGLLQIFDAQKSLGENRPTGTDKRPNHRSVNSPLQVGAHFAQNLAAQLEGITVAAQGGGDFSRIICLEKSEWFFQAMGK